jgi:hypothetical protein
VGKGNCSPTFFEEAEKGRYHEKFIGLLSAEIIAGEACTYQVLSIFPTKPMCTIIQATGMLVSQLSANTLDHRRPS